MCRKKHKYVRWLSLEQTPEGPVPNKLSKWGLTAGLPDPVVPGHIGAGIGAYHPSVQQQVHQQQWQQQQQQPYQQQPQYHEQQQQYTEQQQQQHHQPPTHRAGGFGADGGLGVQRKVQNQTLGVGTLRAGVGQWGAIRTRPLSPRFSHGSILEVLASPAGSPLAAGAGRHQAPW